MHATYSIHQQRPLRLLRGANTSDLVSSVCVSGALSLVCCVLDPQTMVHWFLIPVFISGVIIGVDCFAWLRSRMDLLDPIGWVGAYGYYFFFVAPILTVMWGYRTTELAETPNWRDWIGWMAVLNCCGIIVYFLVRRFLQNREQTSRSTWCFRHNSLIHVMAAALPLTALVQILIYARFGGIWGFMETFSAHDKAFDGMGWQFLIAESFPCLLAIFILVYKRQTLKQAPWTAIALLIAAFFITKLVFGGLRGSRSNTIWAIFWLVGAIHAWIKPVPRRFLMIGVTFLVAFMYVYGFYKQEGTDALEIIRSQDEMQSTSRRTGRTLDAALLGDLARSEIQAYELYRLVAISDYDYAGGSTYIGALTVLIPKSIRPDWIPSKVEKGTEALYGKGTYSSEYRQASQVYGLAGEAMLNFTPLSVPFVFAGLAYVVVKVRAMHSLHPNDARRLLLPFLVIGCIVVLNSDLDNVVVFLLTTSLPAFLAIKCCTRSISSPSVHRNRLEKMNISFPPSEKASPWREACVVAGYKPCE